jgi:hypothetical protein
VQSKESYSKTTFAQQTFAQKRCFSSYYKPYADNHMPTRNKRWGKNTISIGKKQEKTRKKLNEKSRKGKTGHFE